MPRLPIPGSDKGQWGNILNEYLAVEHNPDGTLRSSGSLGSRAPLNNPTFTGSVTVPTPSSATDAVTKQYVDDLAMAGAPDATAATKGIVQLTGDLAGTAASPTVPGLANKENTIAPGTTSQYFRGDKSWQTLNAAAVGLGNVDNISAANLRDRSTHTGTQAISTVTGLQTVLDGKASSGHTHGIGDVTSLQDDLDDKANDNAVVHLSGTETITGNKTFSGTVTVPTPTDATDAVTKQYVDDELGGALDDAVLVTGNQTVAGEKTFTDIIRGDYGANGKTVLTGVPGTGAGVALYNDASADDNHPGLGISSGLGILMGDGNGSPDTIISRAGANNLSFNTARLSNVADPTDAQDAVTKGYVDVVGTEVTNLPELDDGIGTAVDDSVAGFVKVNRVFTKMLLTGSNVSNTTAETSVFTSPLSFAPNELSTSSRLIISFTSQYLNNSGSPATIIFQLKLNTTAILTWSFSSIPSSSTPRALILRVDLGFINFIGIRANGQGIANLSDAGTGLDFGSVTRHVDTGSVHDLASAINLDITMSHSVAHGNVSLAPLGAMVNRETEA